jgi:hypothetical protein
LVIDRTDRRSDDGRASYYLADDSSAERRANLLEVRQQKIDSAPCSSSQDYHIRPQKSA